MRHRPHVVFFEEFDAPVYNQIHQELIVAGETTQNTFENPTVQEQVIVQEIPQAPQVVASFPPFEEFFAPMCHQVLQEQIVATVRPHVLSQGFQVVQIVERIQEQIAGTCSNLCCAQSTVTFCHFNRHYWRQPRHYRFGEPAIFHDWCRGLCATGRWFTSSLTRV